MAPPCSLSSSVSPRLPPHRSHRFTPIPEGSENEELEGSERRRLGSDSTPSSSYHHPTPLHPSPSSATISTAAADFARRSGKKRSENTVAVTCNNCRPNSRDKTKSSVVPIKDHPASYSLSMRSSNGILKSIFCALSRWSPKPSLDTSSASATEDQWKIAATELSQKLLHASRKREEAIQEAARLKNSVAELEKKLNNLEAHCHNINSGFEVNNRQKRSPINHLPIDGRDQIIENFQFFVSEARTAVRSLSQALMLQIHQMSVKVFERISTLLQPYDIRISQTGNPKTLTLYLEALLNHALYEDFESTGFVKNSMNRILNPLDHCKFQYAAFNALQGLTWEEVLSKGTKHFSEDFSCFCDRKMSEIVGMLGWNRTWTEPLLQAFFGASKGVWLVHLLATSVHPGLTIFRVGKRSRFDSVYMEDADVERVVQRIDPAAVQIMVAPGFYVYDNVIKCRVLCKYTSCISNGIITNLSGDGSGTHER